MLTTGETICKILAGLAALSLVACSRPSPQRDLHVDPAGPSLTRQSAISSESTPAVSPPEPAASASAPVTPTPAPAATAVERTLRFAWKPAAARASNYSMSDPEDQHRIILLQGVERNRTYPVVVALHGQPRRGHAPRSYAFCGTVADAAREVVESHAVEPFVLVTPVFRFEGQNWPDFDLAEFMVEVRRIVSGEGIAVGGVYFVGHSGAAGCGGGGLNRVADASPSAVGFFDTCVGIGFAQQVRALSKQGVPTLIMHSVETAGFQPRQPVEYDANFDFGKVYASVGLHAAPCPSLLPEAPLRHLPFRCAINDAATTQALVIDTGNGEKAHEALVPVALRYFLRKYLSRAPTDHP